jgi:hypothetical protein
MALRGMRRAFEVSNTFENNVISGAWNSQAGQANGFADPGVAIARSLGCDRPAGH